MHTFAVKGKTDGFALKLGDASQGKLQLMYDGPRPSARYQREGTAPRRSSAPAHFVLRLLTFCAHRGRCARAHSLRACARTLACSPRHAAMQKQGGIILGIGEAFAPPTRALVGNTCSRMQHSFFSAQAATTPTAPSCPSLKGS